VFESKELLVGEGMEKATLAQIRAIVQAEPAIESVDKLTTMYLGPEEVMLIITLRFRAGTTLAALRDGLASIKRSIRECYPRIRHIFVDSSAICEICD
jgi:divalent metal cation (Fe/Co/Zn/Cd) transporter